MRWVSFTLLFPLVLAACERQPVAPQAVSVPSFAATSDWSDSVVNLPAGDVKYYAPCAGDSLDEVGPIIQSWHTVTTDNGSLLYIKVGFLDGYHNVGDKTGIWNPALPNQEATYVERIPGTHASYTLKFTIAPFFLVNEVSGTKINWLEELKVTINANGEVTVNRDPQPCHIVGK
jgi:hypothetical protein